MAERHGQVNSSRERTPPLLQETAHGGVAVQADGNVMGVSRHEPRSHSDSTYRRRREMSYPREAVTFGRFR
jgi:hypothetical protein